MPEYIEKLQVTVRVSRPGLPPVDGRLSVAPRSELHDGPETLLELLDPAHGFLPFERSADDAMVLLSREDIQWVMVGPGVDTELVRPLAYRYTREERVRVSLRSGEDIDGLIQMELPQNLNRISDYLNGPERCFPLTTRRGTFLVRKAAVREIFLFDASPLPVGGEFDPS